MHSPELQAWTAAADGWRRLGADMVMLYPMYRITNVAGFPGNLPQPIFHKAPPSTASFSSPDLA
jgi:hypothetical protein